MPALRKLRGLRIMDPMLWFGIFGMLFIKGSYVPQLYRMWRTHEVRHISPWFVILLTVGAASYLIYSVWRNDPIYIMSNIAALTFNFMMLGMRYKYHDCEHDGGD